MPVAAHRSLDALTCARLEEWGRWERDGRRHGIGWPGITPIYRAMRQREGSWQPGGGGWTESEDERCQEVQQAVQALSDPLHRDLMIKSYVDRLTQTTLGQMRRCGQQRISEEMQRARWALTRMLYPDD